MSLRMLYHPEANGLAFNVKSYSPYRDGRGTAWQRDSAHERMQRNWWREAKRVAIARGFTDVHAVGRSSGWLVPMLDGEPIAAASAASVTMVQLDALGEVLGRMLHPTTLNERFSEELDIVIAEDECEAADASATARAEFELRDIARTIANDVTQPAELRQRARIALTTLGESL